MMALRMDNCPGSGRRVATLSMRAHQQPLVRCSVCGTSLVVTRDLRRSSGMSVTPRHRALRDDSGVVTRWRAA